MKILIILLNFGFFKKHMIKLSESDTGADLEYFESGRTLRIS